MTAVWWTAVYSLWLCAAVALLLLAPSTPLLPVGVAGMALVAAAGLVRPRWAIPACLAAIAIYSGLWLWLERETGNPAAVLAAVAGLAGVLWLGRNVRGRQQALYGAVRALRRRVEELSTRVEDTGALKLEAGRIFMAEEIERCRRYHRSLALQRLGVAAPEEWLRVHGSGQLKVLNRQLAEVLQENVRTVDRVVQCGAAEYLVLCPDTSADQARSAAQRLTFLGQEQLESELCVGLVEFPQDGQTVEDLLREADAALAFARAANLTIVARE